MTYDFGRWLVGKPMVAFLFALIELFAIYYGSGVMRRHVYNSAVLQGLTSLHSNFTWTRSSPSNHSWHHITRDTRLPDSEDPSFVTIPECAGRTDGRTDRRTDLPYTALAKLALRRAVKPTKGISPNFCIWVRRCAD